MKPIIASDYSFTIINKPNVCIFLPKARHVLSQRDVIGVIQPLR